MFYLRILLSVAVVGLLPAAARPDALEGIRQRGELVWGGDQEGGGPFVFPHEDDPSRVTGFEVELADALAAHLGVKARFFQGPWDKMPELLRTGKVDVAIIFRYGDTEPEPDDIRLRHLLDDPLYLLSTEAGQTLASNRDATWVGGCERCRAHLLSICADEGFEPRIDYVTDDLIVMQSLVAAGLGVTTLPGLALRAHRVEGVVATEIPGSHQRIYAATYGDPPDPPATAALLAALEAAATALY